MKLESGRWINYMRNRKYDTGIEIPVERVPIDQRMFTIQIATAVVCICSLVYGTFFAVTKWNNLQSDLRTLELKDKQIVKDMEDGDKQLAKAITNCKIEFDESNLAIGKTLESLESSLTSELKDLKKSVHNDELQYTEIKTKLSAIEAMLLELKGRM